MYARVASFEGGSTEKMRELNEERMAAGDMPMPDGIRGVTLLSNDAGDRRVFIAFFDSREQVEAAEEQFDRMGDDISEDVRGKRTSVDVYEVVLHQDF